MIELGRMINQWMSLELRSLSPYFPRFQLRASDLLYYCISVSCAGWERKLPTHFQNRPSLFGSAIASCIWMGKKHLSFKHWRLKLQKVESSLRLMSCFFMIEIGRGELEGNFETNLWVRARTMRAAARDQIWFCKNPLWIEQNRNRRWPQVIGLWIFLARENSKWTFVHALNAQSLPKRDGRSKSGLEVCFYFSD